MLGKDEKGYVLSGLGLLLLIPVMIIIPIVLSVESQSSNIPSTFVKSDTAFQTYKSIQNDLTNKVNSFTNVVFNSTYSYNNSSKLANSISLLYNSTQPSVYQTAYGQSVDTLSIYPVNTGNHLTTSNQSGVIPLRNGINIYYAYVNSSLQSNTNTVVYNYTMNVTINTTVSITKANNGIYKSINFNYPFIFFSVDSGTNNNATAQTRINSFFTSLNQAVQPYCL